MSSTPRRASSSSCSRSPRALAAAACELARGSARCLASYQEADRKETGDREELAGDIKDNVGEQFLVPGQEDGAEAKDAAAVGFFERFAR